LSLIVRLQKSIRHSFISLIVNTIPGPDVRVSTSVPLFRNLVIRLWTAVTLLERSKCILGSTVSKNVAANCWKGWIWYYTCGTYKVKHLESAAHSESSVWTEDCIINFSISLLLTCISALVAK